MRVIIQRCEREWLLNCEAPTIETSLGRQGPAILTLLGCTSSVVSLSAILVDTAMLLHTAARTFILLIISSKMFVHCSPIPIEDKEVKIVMENKSQNGGSLGGGLDNLISDMLNRIIQRRLENLLQGVSSSPRKDFQLLESSEPIFSNEDLNKNSAFEEGEGFLEVSVPLSVTEIPKDILTNLPGRIDPPFKLY